MVVAFVFLPAFCVESSLQKYLMHLIQVVRENERRVGVVQGDRARLLESHTTTYSLALAAIREEIKDSSEVEELVRFIQTSKRGVVK